MKLLCNLVRDQGSMEANKDGAQELLENENK